MTRLTPPRRPLPDPPGRPRRHRPRLVALALALAALARPAPARACSTSGDRVRLYDVPAAHRPLPTDGVIAIALSFDGIDLAEGVAGLVVTLEHDGAPIPFTLAVHDLSPPPAPGIRWSHPAVVVVRPDVPLQPSTPYHLRVDHAIDIYDDITEFEVVTAAGPRSSPALAVESAVEPGADEVLARACCERIRDSCGAEFQCEATEVRHHQAGHVHLELDLDGQLHALPFAERLDADGDLIERVLPSADVWWVSGLPDTAPALWTRLRAETRLLPDSGVHCIVPGVIDLVTGAERREDPVCFDTAALALPAPTVTALEPSGTDPCLGPWVDEREGAQEAAGCRLDGAPSSPPALLLLALALVARRPRPRHR